MSAHRLLLSAGSRQLEQLSRDDFLWRPVGEASSLHTTIGPRLKQLGPVPDPHVDFVRLAALVYLVDRTTPRSERRFERDLELTVPVADPDRWSGHADRLSGLLHLLSTTTGR